MEEFEMAKVAFSKLGLKINSDIKIVEFNGQNIEVKQYLPIDKKLELIADVINFSADENNFANPVKVKIFTTIGIIEYYTNITFTEKQKENIAKLYDTLSSSAEMYDMIVQAIPAQEVHLLMSAIDETIKAVYQYKNSVMGVLEMVSSDYSNLSLDASNIQSQLADPNNMELLRSVLSKLG